MTTIRRSIIARNEPSMEAFRTLQASYRALRGKSDGYISSYDLSRPQIEVLSALGSATGLTLKDLSGRVPVTKGTLTGVINRLEERSLVHRAPSDSDRRSTVVFLTPAGEELYEQVFTGHVSYLKQYLDVLDPTEREELVRLLMRIQVASR